VIIQAPPSGAEFSDGNGESWGYFGCLETRFSYSETLCDRLGRSLKDLIELTEALKGCSIWLHSLQESIDTTSSGGQLILHMFGALAEFERNLIRERTQAGLIAARARGRLGGRPKALDPKKRELAVKLYNDRELSIDEICEMMGISKPTLYKYVAEG
jgi:DNA invertase Pin-like site-specific DNA recombinase